MRALSRHCLLVRPRAAPTARRARGQDCETCAFRNGSYCAHYPPREGKQPLVPGRCNFWLPVADADPNPDNNDANDDDEDPPEYEDGDPADDDPANSLSIEGAASEARDYNDDEYEEYDGYSPAVHGTRQ